MLDAIDRHAAPAADVQDAQLAPLGERARAERRGGSERDRARQRNHAADRDPIEIDQLEPGLAWHEKTGEEEVRAQLLRRQPRGVVGTRQVAHSGCRMGKTVRAAQAVTQAPSPR